ncbi:putative fatty acyl-CoA reductase CG5065 [Chironomus tepperi]|uniref:putative fatty acyl-CoA reductase CG5065 n=1 Tax=Chironomus tepperi TaxID=113505 RepID=UPI00391F8CE8
MNSVQEFYKDKTIFITGGSGFMGKVLIEKLLYSCSDLKEIIVLMREKNGKTAKIRVNEFKKIRIFERILNEKPEMMDKIHPIWGDISEPNFGLSDEDTKVYEVDVDPLEVIEKAKVMSEDELSAVQKKMLGKHLNTYTYTKRLSEVLIRDEFNRSNLPVCFVRPSMVSAAYNEPIYGWVDSLNGAPGFAVAIGRGVLRTMLMDVNTTKNYIPVDTCINGYILIAKQIACLRERPKEVLVYNITAHESNTLSMKEYFKICIDLKFVYPFSAGLWYPNVAITTNEFYYYINAFLFQWIPALFIDLVLMLLGQKRLFFIDTKKIDTVRLFRGTVIGGREFLGKDPKSTIPQARIFVKFQYALHLILQAVIYYWLFRKVLEISGFMEPVSNFALTTGHFVKDNLKFTQNRIS